MTRLLISSIIFATLINFFWVEKSLHAAENRLPNIVLIMADDLGYGGVGCYGQTKVSTPNIDQLAVNGMRFTQAYAGCCMCAPTRSVLMTGLHTGHTRVRANDPKQTLLASDITVATQLKKAGYATAGFGKWGIGDAGTPGEPSKHGFDDWVGYLDQADAHFHYPDWIWKGGKKFPLAGNDHAKAKRETFAPDVIHSAALDFIRGNKDRPFFCYLATTIPHAELLVPADSLAEYDGMFPEKPYVGDRYASNPKPRATYAAMVSRMDRDIGKLITLVNELGIERNTLILFTSDNGPINAGGADPDFFNNGGGLRGWKFGLYEGGIRVPLIAAWPGRIAKGVVSELPTCQDDFLPTACDLAGIIMHRRTDGVSILPTLVGKSNQRNRDTLYWESPSAKGLMQAVRQKNIKGIRPNKDALIEVYDLKNDPNEQNDIAATRPDLASRIASLFETEHSPRE